MDNILLVIFLHGIILGWLLQGYLVNQNHKVRWKGKKMLVIIGVWLSGFCVGVTYAMYLLK